MRFLALFPIFAFCSQIGQQAEALKAKGYVWIQGFYSQEEVELLKSWAERGDRDGKKLLSIAKEEGLNCEELASAFPELPIVVPERNDPTKVCRVEDLLTAYPDLDQFVQVTVTNYLEELMNEPYVPFKDKLNFKWPGGGAFPCHQDFPAFEIFGPEEHISCLVCIDEATLENGCLQIARNWQETFAGDPKVDQENLNSGKVVLPFIEGGPMHGTILPELTEQIDWVPLTGKPGDVVFFTSYVPHFSETNMSQSSRRALIITFNRLCNGEHKTLYYSTKRSDPENPIFHFGTPTKARNKGE